MNLRETVLSLFELYGLRNAMYLRGDMRAMALHNRIRSFCKMIRENKWSKDELSGALASVFARTIAYADSFIELPLVESLCEKYPGTNCAYCHSFPCECKKSREGQIRLASVSSLQLEWTITDWIKHMEDVYGAKNRERGIDFMLLRLMEEMHEAEDAHLFDGTRNPNITLTVRRQNIAREFADVLAWIFAIAGVLKLDIQKSVEERYGGKCQRCHKRPCDCLSPSAYAKRANPIGHDQDSD